MADTLFDDLFIPEVAATTARGLTCLRDACPDALEIVVHLEWWKRQDERGPGKSGDWAYLVCAAGFYFGAADDRDEWQGWNHKPRHHLTWDDLRSLLADDPRRPAVIDWADQQRQPGYWRDLYRPYELWPHPETWHPTYIESDRARPGYTSRLTAWSTVQQILADAAARCGYGA